MEKKQKDWEEAETKTGVEKKLGGRIEGEKTKMIEGGRKKIGGGRENPKWLRKGRAKKLGGKKTKRIQREGEKK